MNQRSAISAINQAGILLVFPLNNQKAPHSLWNHFFPKSKMKWEWDDAGDHRVAELWHLREELSRSGKVIYAKWYRGRATFFSKEVFTALLAKLNGWDISSSETTSGIISPIAPMSPEAESLLAILMESSPLSTKQLKKAAEMQGKFFEGIYTKALSELWTRLLIVGYGEVEDGAFPSLNMGATSLMFEALWNAAQKLTTNDCDKTIQKTFQRSEALQKFWLRTFQKLIHASSKA